jgi:hypothetical protein
MGELMNLVFERVSEDMRVTLDREFTKEEVKCASFQMHPSKAAGVDGFTAGFYQRH